MGGGGEGREKKQEKKPQADSCHKGVSAVEPNWGAIDKLLPLGLSAVTSPVTLTKQCVNRLAKEKKKRRRRRRRRKRKSKTRERKERSLLMIYKREKV